MFNPRTPPLLNFNSSVPWNYHGQYNSQWRPKFRPRAPFSGPRQGFTVIHQPVNDNFWCETCDRGFPTEEILNRHRQQHQKCNIDGCQFVAHPKVITKHIQMQHSTGLYKKIANLNKPEDVQKWREERKKRYPTKANIEKKAAFLKEKMDRGEKMGLSFKKNSFNNDKGQGVKRTSSMASENHTRSKFKRNNNDNPSRIKSRKNIPKSLPLVEEHRKLKPFTGILNLEIDNNNEIEELSELSLLIDDDLIEEIIDTEKTVDISEPIVCGALSSLMCDYGSTDEEDNKENSNNMVISNTGDNYKEQKTEETKNVKSEESTKIASDSSMLVDLDNATNSVSKNECKGELDLKLPQEIIDDGNESGPEEVQVIKTADLTIITAQADNTVTTNTVKNKIVPGKKERIFRKPKPKLPSTLLQKLLHREMQQERNIILQCIRYIRKNYYFDKIE